MVLLPWTNDVREICTPLRAGKLPAPILTCQTQTGSKYFCIIYRPLQQLLYQAPTNCIPPHDVSIDHRPAPITHTGTGCGQALAIQLHFVIAHIRTSVCEASPLDCNCNSPVKSTSQYPLNHGPSRWVNSTAEWLMADPGRRNAGMFNILYLTRRHCTFRRQHNTHTATSKPTEWRHLTVIQMESNRHWAGRNDEKPFIGERCVETWTQSISKTFRLRNKPGKG